MPFFTNRILGMPSEVSTTADLVVVEKLTGAAL